MFHQRTALIHLNSHRCVAHESPSCVIIVSPVEHPHYDLHPPQNILADFGFTRVAAILQDTASFVASKLLLLTKFGLDKGIPSKEPDIYTLGITVYQVLKGK
jgi:hypothetical protein